VRRLFFLLFFSAFLAIFAFSLLLSMRDEVMHAAAIFFRLEVVFCSKSSMNPCLSFDFQP